MGTVFRAGNVMKYAKKLKRKKKVLVEKKSFIKTKYSDSTPTTWRETRNNDTGNYNYNCCFRNAILVDV